jgi:exopolyphosphatase/guanosine-5'-triphosphate,3'-diphosphate pyrophosphatase
MNVAVIDIGTNTFNLLIAEKVFNKLDIKCNEKISVKLGRGGIGNNTILPDAIERGLNAIRDYKSKIDTFKIDKLFTIGTSALRTANNANDFITEIQKILGVKVEIISGDREAELIYLGVRQSLEPSENPFLIVDIGGGSNELIIANTSDIIWKGSFPIGMARLNEKFKPSNPITILEIEALENHFEEELVLFFEALKKLSIEFVVGAEGAFETFYNMSGYCFKHRFVPGLQHMAESIKYEEFCAIQDVLVQSKSEDRLNFNGLEPYRVEMVVPASIFVNYILKKTNSQTLLVSPYSLKEGVAWEYFYKNRAIQP